MQKDHKLLSATYILYNKTFGNKISTHNYCRNKNTCCYLTYVNKLTKDKMLACTYLQEKTMLTNKIRHSIIRERKKSCCSIERRG